MNLFRSIYFIAALVGLVVNLSEWLHAKQVYSDLVANRINGTRQMLARMLVKEERLRVNIQALLFVASAIGLYVWARELVRFRVESSGIGVALLVASQLVHIAAVTMLAAKALIVRRDRIAIMHVLHASATVERRGDERTRRTDVEPKG